MSFYMRLGPLWFCFPWKTLESILRKYKDSRVDQDKAQVDVASLQIIKYKQGNTYQMTLIAWQNYL